MQILHINLTLNTVFTFFCYFCYTLTDINMIVKRLLTGVSVCSFSLLLSAQQRVKMVVNDLFVPDKTEVLSGYVGEKLAASYEHRILAQSVDKLIGPFTNRVEDHLW